MNENIFKEQVLNKKLRRRNKLTFKECFELWFKRKTEEYILDQRSPRTLAKFKGNIDNYVLADNLPYKTIANKYVSDLCVQDIIDFKNDINTHMGRTHAKSTIANVFGTIDNVLEFAKHNNQITSEVYNEIKIPARGKPQPSRKAVRNFMSYKEFRHYIDCFDEQAFDYFFDKLNHNCNAKIEEAYRVVAKFRVLLYKAFFEFIFYTGARKNEARGVTWNDIIYGDENFELSRIIIDKQFSEKCASFTNEDSYTRKPKSSNSVRECVLHEESTQALMNFKQFLEAYEMYDSKEFIFKDFFVKEPKPIPETDLDRVFRHFMEISEIEEKSIVLNGINRRITIHGMRHSACSFYLELGMDKRDVATFLGHSNTEMVEYVYSHFINPVDMEEEKKRKNMKFFRSR